MVSSVGEYSTASCTASANKANKPVVCLAISNEKLFASRLRDPEIVVPPGCPAFDGFKMGSVVSAKVEYSASLKTNVVSEMQENHGIKSLPTKKHVIEGEEVDVYLVPVKEFKQGSFYMSLLVGLVDDPQCIIRTANFHKDLCIVWASYKGSTADLAKFTVIALSNPNDCKQYSTRECVPASGFVRDDYSGTVYSAKLSPCPVYLPVRMIKQFKVGDWIEFIACYNPFNQIYMITEAKLDTSVGFKLSVRETSSGQFIFSVPSRLLSAYDDGYVENSALGLIKDKDGECGKMLSNMDNQQKVDYSANAMVWMKLEYDGNDLVPLAVLTKLELSGIEDMTEDDLAKMRL
ncbi:hypothetical protein DdX_02502 [Ditylenchus destructor]|uniref:Uncharacterized protein n=1 Tax=Ditylenchus destructor TaxID=166010 RepID=A0AAD4R639_9BILA|nr:hypothetical protein DdX_02502 [Ditylenchus destructor]